MTERDPLDEYEYDPDYDDDCWNCGGEGFVAHCLTEYACMYPDEGCDLCMRRCEFCAATAQADTHPKGGDSLEAPAPLSGTVGDSRCAHNPSEAL